MAFSGAALSALVDGIKNDPTAVGQRASASADGGMSGISMVNAVNSNPVTARPTVGMNLT